MVKLQDNPCKDCDNRIPGCHSSCNKYKYWKKGYTDTKKKFYENKEEDNLFRDYHYEKKKKK